MKPHSWGNPRAWKKGVIHYTVACTNNSNNNNILYQATYPTDIIKEIKGDVKNQP